jgi:hypothetical protein
MDAIESYALISNVFVATQVPSQLVLISAMPLAGEENKPIHAEFIVLLRPPCVYPTYNKFELCKCDSTTTQGRRKQFYSNERLVAHEL